MNKNKVNKVLVPILVILVVNQMLSGMFGMSLSPGAFGLLHRGGAMALLVAAVLHLILNWAWIKANYLKGLSS
jgi:protein-S-isoprenylcysteine O-methyltransferase Ste14